MAAWAVVAVVLGFLVLESAGHRRRHALTKDGLVTLVAEHAGMTKADANRAIEAFCGAVTTALAKGEGVRLAAVGSFEVQQRGERQGRNVRTGEALTIAASKAVRFVAGSKLTSAVSGKLD